MIDLHTLPCSATGAIAVGTGPPGGNHRYQAIALTDTPILPTGLDNSRIVQACEDLNAHWKIRAIPGIELTHLPRRLLVLCGKSRALGARLVVVHGESVVEPVPPEPIGKPSRRGGHPGPSRLNLRGRNHLAREKKVFLEISARKGHSLANGHVARLAQKCGASMILNTDSHSPDDLITLEKHGGALGAGLGEENFNRMVQNSRRIVERLFRE